MADVIFQQSIDQFDEKRDEFAEASLDLVHLSRQTMGDAELEQEILVLFLIQCESCEKTLSSVPKPATIIEVAHQMKGCAKAVGAWDIGQTAGLLEKNPDNKNLVSKLQDQIHLVKKYLYFLTNPKETGEIMH